MLGDEGVVEKLILRGNLAALQGLRHQLLELFAVRIVTAEPHQ